MCPESVCSIRACEHKSSVGFHITPLSFICATLPPSASCGRVAAGSLTVVERHLRDHDLPQDETLIRLGALRSTWGALATLDLLRLPSPPTAIFAASNAVVPGLFHTIRTSRLAVPGDISLICFDDVDWFSYTEPSITAISNSHTRLADAAVTLLLSRVEAPEQKDPSPVHMEIGFELVLRSSTSAPRRTPLLLRNPWPGDVGRAA